MLITKQSLQKFLIPLTLGIILFISCPAQAHIQAPVGKFGISGSGGSTGLSTYSGFNLQGVYGINDTVEIGCFLGGTPGNLSFYYAYDTKGAIINAKFWESDSIALKSGFCWFASQNNNSNPLGSTSEETQHTGMIMQMGAYYKFNPGITPFVIQSLTSVDGGSGISQTQLGIIFGVNNSLDIILSTARDAQGNGDAQLVLLKAAYYFL